LEERLPLLFRRLEALRLRVADARRWAWVRRVAAVLDREPPLDLRGLVLRDFVLLFERDALWAILTPPPFDFLGFCTRLGCV
jgi:hypothetical protein